MRLIKATGFLLLILTLSQAEFDPTRFNFGADWDYLGKDHTNTSAAQAIDYVSIWLNDPEFNTYWHGDMLKFCKNNNKTPVFYAYIVAKASGLGDSDVGGQLDQQGGAWLKGHFNEVKQRYQNYAQQTANTFGTSRPVIWLMEPDYYQYCNYNGNDISVQDAANYMKEMIGVVKQYLPNALFSLDISPWCNDIGSYINKFDMSLFSFMHCSGGRNNADNDRIRYDNNNNVTYSQVNNSSGKCIIADCGYGTGGGTTGHNSSWDDINNIKGRMQNGVAAITQKAPNDNWGSTINNLKSSLSSTSTKCGFEFPAPKYPLSITIKGEGTVSKSPDATAYDTGTTVTLTASPKSGYKFLSWSGDASGTETTANVVMNESKDVTATFVDVNAKTKFILTVTTKGSGVVEVEPKQPEYDSGATVVLKAYTVNGSTFNGWSGDRTGESQMLTLTIEGNTNLTAAFSGNDISIENMVENGDFSDGEAGWTFGAYESADADGAVADGKFEVDLKSGGTEDWNIQLLQEGISLENGVQYKLTFDASANSSTSIIALIGMAVDPYTSYLRKKVSLTSTQETFEYTFTMRQESNPDARIEFDAGLATAGWTIDNISLTEAIELEPFTGVSYSRPQSHLQFSAGKKATITFYDHAGRVLWRKAGDYHSIVRQRQPQRTGSYITVLEADGIRQVKKTIVLGK